MLVYQGKSTIIYVCCPVFSSRSQKQHGELGQPNWSQDRQSTRHKHGLMVSTHPHPLRTDGETWGGSLWLKILTVTSCSLSSDASIPSSANCVHRNGVWTDSNCSAMGGGPQISSEKNVVFHHQKTWSLQVCLELFDGLSWFIIIVPILCQTYSKMDYKLMGAQGNPENSYVFQVGVFVLRRVACSWTIWTTLNIECKKNNYTQKSHDISSSISTRLQFQTIYGYPKFWRNSNVHQGLPSKTVLGWRVRHHSTETARKSSMSAEHRNEGNISVCFLIAGFTIVLPCFTMLCPKCQSNVAIAYLSSHPDPTKNSSGIKNARDWGNKKVAIRL